MKFGELEIGKDDRPVYPPVIKGVDVLWMPFPDIQPRFALQQQPDKGSSSGRGDGEEEGAGREEQQKSKLQKPDKKLLSSSTAESSSAAGGDSSSGSKGQEKGRDSLNSSGGGPRKDSGARPTGGTADKPNTAEPGTLNAMLPDLDEEIDENDGSWLSGGGLRFAVDSNRAYELDEARAAASVVVYDPLRGAGELAAQKMQQRRQQQAIAWKEGQRNIEKW
ncbi:UNVERIFIED_CONTAM: hypothetical protein H355_015355 [Colinus virginianus]|nr:hypothetical protein H355_015355 [Colinus virginianus]